MEEHREEIVAEIFQACDIDKSGQIEIEEFVKHFVTVRRELKTKKEEVENDLLKLNGILKTWVAQQKLILAQPLGTANATSLVSRSEIKITVDSAENFICDQPVLVKVCQGPVTNFKETLPQEGPVAKWGAAEKLVI